MVNITIIGSGGREHAVSKALLRSSINNNGNGDYENLVLNCISTYENPGMKVCKTLIGDIMDNDFVVSSCKSLETDIAFIGPEAPLGNGVVDALKANSIRCVGPTKDYSQIETSKTFTRRLLMNTGLEGHNPKFISVKSKCDMYALLNAVKFMATLAQSGINIVIKCDGLKGGKGVTIFDHEKMDEAIEHITHLHKSDEAFLIEECKIGEEFSLMSFSSGNISKGIRHMPIVRDFKRLNENDDGPNTGGMGSLSYKDHSMPFLSNNDVKIAQQLNELICMELRHKYRGNGYQGILYGSFMKCNDGIFVIEYNCRFGDPESINILSILETDLVEIFDAISYGRRLPVIEYDNVDTLCKYIVPNGYPTNSQKTIVRFSSDFTCYDNIIYASAVSYNPDDEECDTNERKSKDGKYVLSKGSRMIAVIGNDSKHVEKIISLIQTDNTDTNEINTQDFKWRKDISHSIFTGSLYEKSGVSIERGDEVVNKITQHIENTKQNWVKSKHGDFSCIIQTSEIPNPEMLIASIDGVGTKTEFILKHMNNKEGLFSLGQDIVNHSVNDILVKGALPIAFLDYYASSKIEPSDVESFVAGVAFACKNVNCALVGGETAEMPGTYKDGARDFVGTIIGSAWKSDIINGKTSIKEGDYIIGLYSSGPHTNGYSLIRQMDKGVNVYPLQVFTQLVAPHRHYLNEYNDIRLKNIIINGMCHITGGGFYGNIPRIMPDGLCASIHWNSWIKPEWYNYVIEETQMDIEESRSVFNCGLGMLLFVDKNYVSRILDICDDDNSVLVGEVVKGNGVKFV
jgi:phosphoribosylamine--glycine ligase/phosphoribosylaminoimidazole synthetase